MPSNNTVNIPDSSKLVSILAWNSLDVILRAISKGSITGVVSLNGYTDIFSVKSSSVRN